MRTFRLFYILGFSMVILQGILSERCTWAQVVQLPTAGTFSLSTSVSVPDSGSASLGSSNSSSGSIGRGPMGARTMGAARGGGGLSVQSTVIDLAELDSMIRSQSGKAPVSPQLHSSDPQTRIRVRAPAKGRIEAAEYDYLATLSRNGNVVETLDSDAVAYYLGLAERARNRGTWSAVELYYSLAWKSLPLARREAALQELAKARASGKSKDAGTGTPKKSK